MNEVKLRTYATWALFGTVLVPLAVFNGFLIPFTSTKVLFFTTLIEVSAALYIFSLFRKLKITLRWNYISILFLGMIVLATISTIFSANPFISFFGTVERMEGLFLWLHVGLFLFLLQQLFGEKEWSTYLALSVWVSLVVSIFGFSQVTGGVEYLNNENRVDAFFGNPVFLSLYILFHIGFASIMLLRSKNFMRVIYGAIIVLHLVILFYSGTRGAILALIASILVGVLVIVLGREVSKRIRMVAAGFLLSLMLLGGLFYSTRNSSFVESHPVLSRFSVISLDNLKNQSRYYLWEASLDGIAENPVVGVGFEQFHSVFDAHLDPAYFGPGLSAIPEPWADRAHNVYLDLAVAHGVPLLLLFLSTLLYVSYRIAFRLDISDVERAVLLGLLAAYAVHSLFNFSVVTGIMFLVIALMYVSRTVIKETNIQLSALSYRMLLTLSLMLVVVGSAFSVNRVAFSLSYERGIVRTDTGSVERFEHTHGMAGRAFVDCSYALRRAAVSAGQVVESGSITEHERMLLLSSVREDEIALESIGQESIKELFLFGKTYRLLEAYDDSERVLMRANERAPERQNILIERGLTARASGNHEQALQFFEEAYKLEPQYRNAILEYAAALVFVKDIDTADEILINEFGTTIIVYESLLDAYMASGLRDRVREALREALEARPDDERFRELDEKFL